MVCGTLQFWVRMAESSILLCGVGVWPIVRNVIELLFMLVKVKIHTFFHGGRVWNLANLFEDRVDRSPNCIQFITAEDGQITTSLAIEKLANQFSHWGLEVGFQQKNTVCLMVLNRPEYVAFWVGMAKIGVSTALLNTNITGKPFIHSVQLSVEKSEKKIVVVDQELVSSLQVDLESLHSQGIRIIILQELLQEIGSSSSPFPNTRPPRSCRDQIKESDPMLFVFTSGTTGLPKAAKISSSRFYMMTLPSSEMAYLREGERMYCALPLYHSAGGILGAGAALVTGATLVFRKKFSASQFTNDCLKYRCTSMQYIGELCRYLLHSPPNPNDTNLTLRYAIGNGLRSEVWLPFQKRFGIGRIIEFYSATEANVALLNSSGKVGALGCVPRVIDFLYPVR
jgi:fatty-acyl-CoA synthase